ncbi:hypothetical protein PIB30_097059 [Stylosanthes scabra]|uniref:Uncharacterized protein n=1 Tax=Stylosanthes scabra TaxID=79078 RepID=A0ABU6YVS1_9FABA|nr:hypothetical protein [Stylosanthes scabra]
MEKEQKEAWKARKEENRAIGQNRATVSITESSRLGVAEPHGPFGLIQHPTPRRDARRLGVDEAARKWSCTKTSTPWRAPKTTRHDYVKLEANQASQHPRLSAQCNA